MNCHEAEPLLFTERDGVLTQDQHAALARHYESCDACRQRRTVISDAMAEFQAEYARVEVPNVDHEWRALRSRLSPEKKSTRRRFLAPLLWFGVPAGAAAALAFAFFGNVPERPQLGSETLAQAVSARAEFVELTDKDSSPLVYVDKDSGWLVVWAVDGVEKSSG